MSKSVLVIGGTGSVGQAYVDRVLGINILREHSRPDRVTILSRDESKQHALRTGKYRGKDINWIIGDIRDLDTMRQTIPRFNTVIHAAAMKHVPMCEQHPEEAVKTNIIGAMNIIQVAKEYPNSLSTLVGCSTDKACEPATTMGTSKAMMERIFLQPNLDKYTSHMKVACVRYGNILESRGSVLHTFIRQARAKKSMTVTDPHMTRFVNSLEDAAETIDTALVMPPRRIHVKKGDAVQMTNVAKAVWSYYQDSRQVKIEYIGARPYEKIHENLISEAEWKRSIINGEWIAICPDGMNENKDEFPLEMVSNHSTLNQDETNKLVFDILGRIESHA